MLAPLWRWCVQWKRRRSVIAVEVRVGVHMAAVALMMVLLRPIPAMIDVVLMVA